MSFKALSYVYRDLGVYVFLYFVCIIASVKIFTKVDVFHITFLFFFILLLFSGVFALLVFLKVIKFSCPFCRKLGQIKLLENKEFVLSCSACGDIHSKGSFVLRFTKEKLAKGALRDLSVDLGYFTCNKVMLGESLIKTEPFSTLLKEHDTLEDEFSGIEIDVNKNHLESIFITMENSRVKYFKSGEQITLNGRTKIDDIRAIFGSPYWEDDDCGEVILFYEYLNGKVELQFEFPKKSPLGFICLSLDGVLSSEDQRKSYGVTKAWPPVNTRYR